MSFPAPLVRPPASVPPATPPSGQRRRRKLAAGGLVLALAAATVGYVLVARDRALTRAAAAPAVARVDLASVLAVPHVVFRSTALDPSYGKVSVVRLDDPTGPRAVTDVDCDRVYAAAQRYVCLSADRGLMTTYDARVLGPDMKVLSSLPLLGIPSRTRLSDDASLASTTAFVAGHSYADRGFSTQTLVSDLAAKTTVDLEDFTLRVDGRLVNSPDRNFWGVTFDGPDRFYATASAEGQTHLVRGSLVGRVMESLQGDAECPSLSPDRTTVVYKKRQGRAPGRWRLASYDLASGTETLLAETRTVDDQVEWLDDERVLYGLPRPGTAAAITDVWMTRADGSGAPEVLLPQAWSPAVVRRPGVL